MRFGVFGREQGSFVLIYKKKGIDVKMLHRKFSLQVKPTRRRAIMREEE